MQGGTHISHYSHISHDGYHLHLTTDWESFCKTEVIWDLVHSQKPICPPLTTRCHSWHMFWTNQWLKASHFLLLIRIWSIVSFKIMMMIAKAHVWACKIRLEPVWCPRFACGLVLTFSFAHRHSSTSLIFTWKTVCCTICHSLAVSRHFQWKEWDHIISIIRCLFDKDYSTHQHLSPWWNFLMMMILSHF